MVRAGACQGAFAALEQHSIASHWGSRMAAKKKEKEVEETASGEADAPKGEGEAGEGAEGAEGEGAPKKGKKKLIIIAAVVLLAVLGGVGFLLTSGGGDEEEEHAMTEEEMAAAEAANKPVYYELPEFLVNLSTGGNRVSFLKMSVTLELRDQAAVKVLEANKPRVLDVFNTYLREMRPTDVQGSAGIYRLREELMARLNGTVEEGLVKNILFSEIIVQ